MDYNDFLKSDTLALCLHRLHFSRFSFVPIITYTSYSDDIILLIYTALAMSAHVARNMYTTETRRIESSVIYYNIPFPVANHRPIITITPHHPSHRPCNDFRGVMVFSRVLQSVKINARLCNKIKSLLGWFPCLYDII